MQQSQAVVSLLLWGTTITLLVWPYVSWRFSTQCDGALCFSATPFNIPSTYVGLAVIFLSVMFAVLLIGYLYDQVFSLWTEWRSVDMERPIRHLRPFTDVGYADRPSSRDTQTLFTR